jgi:membrane associated rhomboid family serine protease
LIGVITAVNGAVLVVIHAHPSLYQKLLPTGAEIDEGEGWRCLTSLVVHHNLVHLVINTALLVGMTPFALRRLTWLQYLAVYVVGGFAANAVRYAVGGRHGGGASGAIVAVAATAAVLELLDRDVSVTAVDAAVAAALVFGAGAARLFSDNHLLAAGIGGAVAAYPTHRRSRLSVATVVLGVTGVVAMAARIVAVR